MPSFTKVMCFRVTFCKASFLSFKLVTSKVVSATTTKTILLVLFPLTERHNRHQTCDRLWSPFQDTANTITLLYKGIVCYLLLFSGIICINCRGLPFSNVGDRIFHYAISFENAFSHKLGLNTNAMVVNV